MAGEGSMATELGMPPSQEWLRRDVSYKVVGFDTESMWVGWGQGPIPVGVRLSEAPAGTGNPLKSD